ncbi:AbrB/MazE/SpoVT family DNA-binding domain-containing protein [Candidatus Pacearchaeota archaeon]|nr:AbrB/MazE/SpoVT family DNA-binding domain-containing protein [Candidatus Pacearchaeota archaeon]
MTEISITRMSSKGQIVIPIDMRKGIKEGEKLLIIQSSDGKLIIKKASESDENFQEDLEFARRTEEAWQRHERGEFTRMDSGKFLEEIKKW